MTCSPGCRSTRRAYRRARPQTPARNRAHVRARGFRTDLYIRPIEAAPETERPAVARVEPLTTARALRGPFDYERTDDVVVGSVVRVPFGGRDVLGVVTELAARSEHALSAP